MRDKQEAIVAGPDGFSTGRYTFCGCGVLTFDFSMRGRKIRIRRLVLISDFLTNGG
jgi:hypothetical protein